MPLKRDSACQPVEVRNLKPCIHTLPGQKYRISAEVWWGSYALRGRVSARCGGVGQGVRIKIPWLFPDMDRNKHRVFASGYTDFVG